MHAGQVLILPELRNEAQRDRLDRVTAVSADRGSAAHRRRGNVGVRVDADDAFDRVDRRDAVRAAALCRLRRRAHARHVRRKLCKDRQLRSAPCRRGKALDKLRHLSDVRAEPFIHHVRAGEIQLDRVRAVLLAKPAELLPLRVVLPHDRGKNEFGRIIPLETPEDLHVLGDAVVGKLLDVLVTIRSH